MAVDYALSSNGGVAQSVYGDTKAGVRTQFNDGNPATYYQIPVTYPNLPGAWVDLQEPRTVIGFGLEQYGGVNYQATSVRIQYSTNDLDWATAYEGPIGATNWEISFTATLARYWRIHGLAGGAGYWWIYGVHVWVDEYQQPSPPSNTLASDLMFKMGSRYAEVYTPWLLLQNAPSSFSPEVMLATLALWNNWLLDECYRLLQEGGGTGSCPNTDPDNQAVFNRIVAAETQVGQDIDDLQTIMNQQYLVVTGGEDHSLSDLYHRLEFAENYIYQAVQNLEGLIKGLSGIDLTHLHDDLQSGISAIAANDNANTAAIRGDPVTDLRSLTTTMTTSFSTQTGELRGPLGTTHDAIAAAVGSVQSDVDDILEALTTLPSTSGSGPVVYPGSASVQWGTPVEVQGEAIVSALTYGVNGRMDGVAVLMLSGSPRVTDRQAAGVLNYRYAGFMAFGDNYDHWDEPQYLNLDHRIYVGKGMRDPKLCLIAGSPGVTMQVTPWVIANP